MVKRATPSTSWDQGNEEVLIEFLESSLAAAGDGVNFKQATWNAAAEHMIPFTTKGGVKMAKACRNKFTQVCTQPCSLIAKLMSKIAERTLYHRHCTKGAIGFQVG
jgi:hypothetical protein